MGDALLERGWLVRKYPHKMDLLMPKIFPAFPSFTVGVGGALLERGC